jgi:hypothetical protein
LERKKPIEKTQKHSESQESFFFLASACFRGRSPEPKGLHTKGERRRPDTEVVF